MEMNCTSSNQNPTTCFQPNPLEEDELYNYFTYLWWMEGFGSIMIGSLGIIFNLITIFVVLGSDLAAHFFNWLLVCLAMLDNLHLLNGILEALRNHFGISQLNYVYVFFLHYFRSVIMCSLEYMKLLIALERYNAFEEIECHQTNCLCRSPYTKKNYFAMYWARLIKYVGPIIFFTSILYIPKFMEVQFVDKQFCSQPMMINQSSNIKITCFCTNFQVVRETDFRQNDTYILWYLNVTNLLVTVFIPLTSLIYLYFNILKKLKRHTDKVTLKGHMEIYSLIDGTKSEEGNTIETVEEHIKRRGKRQKILVEQTIMLFAMVIFFLISHTPRSILNLEEFARLKNMKMARTEGCVWFQYWTAITVPVSHILLQVNSSITIFIYCVFNSLFRETLKHKLGSILVFLFKGEHKVPQSNECWKISAEQIVKEENIQENYELYEYSTENTVITEADVYTEPYQDQKPEAYQYQTIKEVN